MSNDQDHDFKTCIVCQFCKKLFYMGTVHSCVVEIIDLDSKPGRLRRAIVKSKISWVPPEEKNDGR
jgi:uncharacterized protein with PIN domain